MTTYLYCDRDSKSAPLLAEALKVRRLRKNIAFDPADVVINWGSPNLVDRLMYVLNKPSALDRSVNKLRFFREMAGTGITPAFTTSKKEAASWIDDGQVVVCRTILTGHSGAGIVIAKTKEELVDAKLYVRYINKSQEWRVHVLNGKVFDMQRKARAKDVEDKDVNWEVRNLKGGFIYARGDIDAYDPKLIPKVKQHALTTLATIGLDFGAVDIITTKAGAAYVLEINSAPGLKGTTLGNYAAAFRGKLNAIRA